MSLPSTKRGRRARNKEEKKAKTSTGHWLQEEMGKPVRWMKGQLHLASPSQGGRTRFVVLSRMS
jgi:hypothetical protein